MGENTALAGTVIDSVVQYRALRERILALTLILFVATYVHRPLSGLEGGTSPSRGGIENLRQESMRNEMREKNLALLELINLGKQFDQGALTVRALNAVSLTVHQGSSSHWSGLQGQAKPLS